MFFNGDMPLDILGSEKVSVLGTENTWEAASMLLLLRKSDIILFAYLKFMENVE